MPIYRTEHPDPIRFRPRWLSLNGEWDFALDSFSAIRLQNDPRSVHFTEKIQVPFVYQCTLSGIGEKEYYPYVWYRRFFSLPPEWMRGQSNYLLHFGAVDYEADVWLNGKHLGSHTGGHTPFHFLLPPDMVQTENELTIRVFDPLDPAVPRGKQSFASPFECWYTPSTGIWQPVWLECVGSSWIEDFNVHCDSEKGSLSLSIQSSHPLKQQSVYLRITQGDTTPIEFEKDLPPEGNFADIFIPEPQFWSPESPVLYQLELELRCGKLPVDNLCTYFAFRSISIQDGKLLLNGSPLYLRFTLDQGYWPESLISAPDDESFRRDIRIAQSIGMNGCRKHVKIEDPRFLYWADTLGFLVWTEAPSFYSYTAAARERFEKEWEEVIKRDRAHPSIMSWIIFNESWGIPNLPENMEQQEWVMGLVKKTRRLDPGRFVISNDGWEHLESDLATMHSYAPDASILESDIHCFLNGKTASNGKKLWADGSQHTPDPPALITEFGGIAFAADTVPDNAWGYNRRAVDADDFEERIRHLMTYIRQESLLQGFVYTQLTDVEQEINGLFTSRRKPKIPIDRLHSLFTWSDNP